MNDPKPQDFEARERALDVSTSFIVQAPAGSGKTALLTRRFLRLLAVVERPEQVLAITFTRKAADEMRARILAALRAAAQGVEAANAFESALYADAAKVLVRDADQQWALLDAPNRLQIMTVDSLNARLVSARPITSGQLGQQLLGDDERARLYERTADAVLDWLADTGEIGDAIRIAFDQVDLDSAKWRRRISAMLATRDVWLPSVLQSATSPSDVLRANSERVLGELIDSAISAICALIDSPVLAELHALLCIARDNLDSAAGFSDDLTTALGEPAFWRFAVSVLLIKPPQQTWRKALNKTVGLPAGDKAVATRAKQLLAALHSIDGLHEALIDVTTLPDRGYSDEQWMVIQAAIQTLRISGAEFHRLLSQDGRFDYPEQAANALSTLGHGSQVTEFALQFDYRLQHILVDEMQDTSAAQYRLIERLIAGWQPNDGRTLFCVGDPMQSIFRFRGADVSLFLKAWNEGLGGVALESVKLTTNFRSARPVVEWANDTFASILGDAHDALRESVAHAVSTAAPEAAEQGQVQWHFPITDRSGESTAVVDLARDLCQSNPSHRVAIIARTRNALAPTLDALQRAEIPFESIDMERLVERPEVQELITLTRALEMPDDDIAWLGCLRAPWCALTLAEVDAMMRLDIDYGRCVSQRIEAALEHHCWNDAASQRVAEFLRCVAITRTMAATIGLRERVERLWGALGGAALLNDTVSLNSAEAYLAALEQLEQGGQLQSPARIHELLKDRKVNGGIAGAQIVVMTIYSSKGLEFEHVLLPGLNVQPRNDQAPALRIEARRTSAGPGLLFAAADQVAMDSDADWLNVLLSQLDRRRANNETRRLLYVAATRARSSLHLFARLEANAKAEQWKAPARTTLLAPLWGRLQEQLPPVSGDQLAQTQTRDRAVVAQPLHVRFDEPWTLPSSAAPRTGTSSLEGVVDANEDARDLWASDTRRHIGTVVHEWLQVLAGNPEPLEALHAIPHLQRRTELALGRRGVAIAERRAASDTVLSLLDTALTAEDGQWLVGSSHPDNAVELSILTQTPSGARRMIVDRIVRDDVGTLWVVDYKTSITESDDVDAFLAAEKIRYQPQVEAYAAAIRGLPQYADDGPTTMKLGLYFLAYGRLIEWSLRG